MTRKEDGLSISDSMPVTETIHAKGHVNVCGNHKSTFEITKETELSPNGDCIIAVASDKGCADLSEEFKTLLSKDDTILTTKISCGGIETEIKSYGSSKMTLTHPTDLVWRRSAFVCSRTIGIYSDKTARQIPRELISALQKGEEIIITLTAESEAR